ncbi:MAG: D-alanyl-D-alanine carboxypeptidase/D-alanyl-D-alanine-endopeptidase [Gemmatimonadetes bacterium]|nr:D-alanyl-D-alanine carboxypeptidase/D-alanyl-D-alanine-endopeptidase [Gemmatimonadota bacterium]
MRDRKDGRAGWLRWARTAVFVGLAASAAATPAGRSIDEERLDARVRALREDLRGAVSSNGWRSARYSVLALSLETGDTLFAHGAHDRLAPASNLKLLTTATALRYLGPDFRYQTFLLADGPIESGHLKGDLVLYGTGDPGLSEDFQGTAAFGPLADSLVAAGVSVVEGAIVGDGTFFSGPLLGDGWNPEDLNDWFTAPSSGLTYAENMVTLRVVPAAAGAAPVIHTIPDGAELALSVTAMTGRGAGRVQIRRTDPSQPVTIDGSITPGGREIWRQMTVSDPAANAASVFRKVLASRGIEVVGGVRTVGDASSSRVTRRSLWAPSIGAGRSGPRMIARHESPPLIEYLKIVNKKSHNLFADVTLKTVGRVVRGDGSFAGGSAVVRGFLASEVKTDTAGLVMLDGSGLSSMDRMSASTFVDVLKHMARSDQWSSYWETLPEAGNQRELRRMYQTPAAGNLRAKTGTIEHVSALSGVVRSANGERILFSIIANDVPTTYSAKRIEDRIGISLASFERPFSVSGPELRLASDSVVADTGVVAAVGAPSIAAAPTPAPAPPVAAALTAPSSPAARTHTVQKGDNLSVIARRYGVTLNALVAANPKLSPRRLMPWVQLEVPAPVPTEDATAPADRTDVQVHTVKSGDNFSTIARAYDVSVNALIEANPGVNLRRLQVRQKIRIPAPTEG